MDTVEKCIEGFSHLNQAERLLSQVRLHSGRHPIREAINRHREMLAEARRHIESAQTLCVGC